MNWNWDHLRYFNSLAEQGTLSEAARHLNVSHSTVQRHISSLEDELDVQLFNQMSSGYVLTEAGTQLYNETAGIRDVLRSISTRISGTDQELSGRVAITLTDTLGHFLLPSLVKRIRTEFPDIELELSILNKLSDMQNLEADIAIRTSSNPPPELIGRKIGDVGYALCATNEYLEKHTLDVSNAAQLAPDVVQLDSSIGSSLFHDWLPHAQSDPVITKVNSFMGAYSLCKSGYGLALIPSYITQFDDQLIVLQCDNLPDSNSLWVLSPAELRTSERVRAVRTLIFDSLEAVFT